MSPAAIISELEARTAWSDRPGLAVQQRTRLSRIEDYLLINGDRLSAARAEHPLRIAGAYLNGETS